MIDLKVKILNPLIGSSIPLPEYSTEGSAGLDLRACVEESFTLKPQECQLFKIRQKLQDFQHHQHQGQDLSAEDSHSSKDQINRFCQDQNITQQSTHSHRHHHGTHVVWRVRRSTQHHSFGLVLTITTYQHGLK